MRAFLSGLAGSPGPDGRRAHGIPAPLADLIGQTIVHTRVAARGTWAVTARGSVLSSRTQLLAGMHGLERGATPGTDPTVGLRYPRGPGRGTRHATEAGRAALGPSGAEALPPGMSSYDSPGVVGPFRHP